MRRKQSSGIILPSLVLVSSMISCNGSAQAILPEQPVDVSRTSVVFLGDSLTEGYGVSPGEAFPSLIDGYWRSRGIPYRVVNLGVSGDTTSDVLARLSGVPAHAALVVLEIGANDAFREIPVEEIRENIDRILTSIRKNGNPAALVEMNVPITLVPGESAYLRRFNGLYADAARQAGIPLIPSFLKPLFPSRSYRQADGIHPTAEGHRLLASKILRDLNPAWSDFR